MVQHRTQGGLPRASSRGNGAPGSSVQGANVKWSLKDPSFVSLSMISGSPDVHVWRAGGIPLAWTRHGDCCFSSGGELAVAWSAFSLLIASRLSITSASPRSRRDAAGSAVASGTGGTRPAVAAASPSATCPACSPPVCWLTQGARPALARRWTDGHPRGGVSPRRSSPGSVARCSPGTASPGGSRRLTCSTATATCN